MGYSIFLHTEKYKEIYDFLDSQNIYNYFEIPYFRLCYGIDSSSGISYNGEFSDNIVGFDYSSGIPDDQRRLIYCILSILAKKLNIKNYYYDGEECNIIEDIDKFLNRRIIFIINSKEIKKIKTILKRIDKWRIING